MNRMGSVVAELANHPDYIRTMKRQFFGWFLRALMVAGKLSWVDLPFTLISSLPHPLLTPIAPWLHSHLTLNLPNLTLRATRHLTLTSTMIYPHFNHTLPTLKPFLGAYYAYKNPESLPDQLEFGKCTLKTIGACLVVFIAFLKA